MQTIAFNDRARVFVFPDGVNGCGHKPVYGDCFSVEGLTQDGGEITKVECPDPRQYGKFIEIGSFRGERGRLTTTLTRRMTMKELSFLRTLFDRECPGDVHIHWGECTDPTAFNQYQMAWILPKAYFTNWSTDTTIAQQSGDRAPVNESVDVSAADFIQVKATLSYSRRASSITPTDDVVDVVLCDARACAGDACAPSTGCDKYYALDNVDKVFKSIDGGDTWTSTTIPDINVPVGAIPVGMACVGSYLVFVMNEGSVSYILRNDFDLGVSAWTTLTEVVDGVPTSIISLVTSALGSIGYIATTTGQVYQIDSSMNVTLVDDSTSTGDAINGMTTNGEFSLAVGADGLVMFSDGEVWSKSPTAPAAVVLHAALIKSEKTWYVGGASGNLWCTSDGGCTWKRVLYPSYAAGGAIVTDLCASNDHVLWMAANGKVYRSIDGGSTWVIEPNDSTPGCQAAASSLGTVAKLVCCTFDANRVVAVGTGTGSTGLIMLGE